MTYTRQDILDLIDYVEHDISCIRTTWRGGRPTSDGGYETNFGGKWYQSRPINKEPKCDCRLDELLERLLDGKN